MRSNLEASPFCPDDFYICTPSVKLALTSGTTRGSALAWSRPDSSRATCDPPCIRAYLDGPGRPSSSRLHRTPTDSGLNVARRTIEEWATNDSPVRLEPGPPSVALSGSERVPQRSSSIGQARKQNEQKRVATKTSTPSTYPSTDRRPVMSEQVFEELGDDDDTVRRIRELKQQRASRLLHVDVPAERITGESAKLAPPAREDADSFLKNSASDRPHDHLPQTVTQADGSAHVSSGESNRSPGRLRTPNSKRLSSTPWRIRASRKSAVFSTPPADEDPVDRRHSQEIGQRIDTFLSSARFNQSVSCPRTGRKISFSEVGDPQGSVVMVCVGMGLSRFVTAFYDELASSLRLRLITPERPGIGDSDAHQDGPRSGPLSWHQDVLMICNQLQITQFSLLGHSAGAIYALATALALPTFVREPVYLLAPWIPPSQFSTVVGSAQSTISASTAAVASLPRSQRLLRILPVQVLKAANATFLGLNTGSISPPSKRSAERRNTPSPSSSPGRSSRTPTDGRSSTPTRQPPVETVGIPKMGCEDQMKVQISAASSLGDSESASASDLPSAFEHQSQSHRDAYSALLTERIWDLATRNSNPAIDLLVCLEREQTIGFRYVDVPQRVIMLHGDQDRRVPIENVQWLADRLKHHQKSKLSDLSTSVGPSELRVLVGEGHGLMASAVVMANVLTELSNEVRCTKTDRK